MMNFGSFLGNEALKERLSAALRKNRLSHCYLISGPQGSGKHSLSLLLAAAMQCSAPEKPCLSCPRCRKVLSGNHPDLITVDEPDKKSISVKKVREACADLYIRPNEGNKKIYLFPRAHELNVQSQNALLKCMEEPPAYGVFLLLCEHSQRLLPTIRSRCVELSLSPLPREVLLAALEERFPHADAQTLSAAMARSGGYLGQALRLLEENSELFPQSQALLEAFAGKRSVALLQALVPMERMKREQLQPILEQCHSLVASALSCQKSLPPIHPLCASLARSCSSAQLLDAADALLQAQQLLRANVSCAHVCGLLEVLLDRS